MAGTDHSNSHPARQVAAVSDDYPPSLRGLPAEFAPPVLWIRGDLPGGRAVAVVGARKASAAALVAARNVASGLVGGGCVVVSGGALGVDGAAHRGALDAGGSTVVVLGTGIDVAYPPRHAPLFQEAVTAGGALVSQFPPGVGPSPWSFPRRNAVIAALSEVVIVVEAGTGSGALHTAAAARKLGRPVVVMTGSSGCDRLAAAGVSHGADADEVLALALGEWVVPSGAARRPEGKADAPRPARISLAPLSPAPPDDPRALRLYMALDGTPRDLSELAARAGMGAAEAMAIAIDLEIGGHAARAAGGRYLRLS